MAGSRRAQVFITGPFMVTFGLLFINQLKDLVPTNWCGTFCESNTISQCRWYVYSFRIFHGISQKKSKMIKFENFVSNLHNTRTHLFKPTLCVFFKIIYLCNFKTNVYLILTVIFDCFLIVISNVKITTSP